MKTPLHLSFIPRSADAGLLLLRLWAGLPMLLLHGLPKLLHFDEYSKGFLHFLGLSSGASLGLAVFGELVCAALLIVGLFTRWAALVAAITMAVAFFVGHGGALTGADSGELAYLYLGIFAALFLSGAGRFSVDNALLRRDPAAA
jgi:putative oxidoreductase